MIRESTGQGSPAFAFATPPRGGIDPPRMPEASRGTRETHRNGKPETATSTERPEARSFGERIAEARRDAERASARRMQSRVEQRAGDRPERSSSATATNLATAGETRRTSEHDRRDATDAAAGGGAVASDGTAPTEALHATPQTATHAAPHAAAAASNPAEAPVPDWTAGPGTDASNHADVGPGTGADGDPEAGGDPAMVADHSAEPSDSAAATPIPSGLDLAASGVRRGASGHDPADFASRLAQAADNAAIGATGHAPAASVTLGTPYPGTAASAGSTPVHVGSIATPLSDPAFAGHLAGETLKLAIAGVEHAQISVQPKDLGPIRIELSLNGESARIAFSATQPDTRQAIEQSLPILEDMLAEHGLLLADANVSDQRGGDAEGGKHAGRAPGADPDSSPKRGYGASGIDEIGSREADGAAPVPLIRRGLVDLYA